MAAGAWDGRVNALAAVLGAAFARRGSQPQSNPYRPAVGPTGDPRVMRDIRAKMFEEGLRQIARKAAARSSG